MAVRNETHPVKLFIITFHHANSFSGIPLRELIERYGPLDYQSQDYAFDETDYYREEMGSGLMRRFLSFEKLIQPGDIVEVKSFTNSLEQQSMVEGKRIINLDAGYLDHYKVVLASYKFGGQKIYLQDGVYADMTLIRYKNKWESFAWGFPDFKSGKYDAELNKIRDLFKAQTRRKDMQDV